MKNFSKRQTNILKGIAIVLLMIHHGLDPIPEEVLGGWKNLVENSISLAKLCVAIFAVLSGYGMYLSFQKKQKDGEKGFIWRFLLSHILKLYAVFWLIALISIGAVAIVKGNIGEIYSGYTLYEILLDVMGLSYLTASSKFVNSWWYVTAALVYYCLFPVLYRIVQKLGRYNGILVLALAAGVFCFPGANSVLIYGCSFLFGMIFAECDVVNRFLNSFDGNRLQICLKEESSLFLLIGLCLFRQKFLFGTKTEYYLDWLIALVLILLISEAACHKKYTGMGLLELTGRYSFEIYLVHAVFIKYFGSYVYMSCHCWAVLFRLFTASFLAAVMFGWLEKRFGFSGISAWCMCREKKGPARAAALLLGTILLLLLPTVTANMGIGNLTFYEREIQMESGTWYVPMYTETPLFWNLANKTYSSGEGDMVSFVDGVLYAHYEGQTEVTVSLPFGKSASCTVTVEEAQ